MKAKNKRHTEREIEHTHCNALKMNENFHLQNCISTETTATTATQTSKHQKNTQLTQTHVDDAKMNMRPFAHDFFL